MTKIETAPTDGEVELLRQTVAGLERQVARLTERLDAADPAAPMVAAAHPAPSQPVAPTALVDRRHLLRRSAAVAAGAVAGGVVLGLGAEPAAAANGANLVLGSASNGATAATGLTMTGIDRPYGIGVTDNGLGTFSGNAAVLGHAKISAFNTGVYGLGENGAEGVRGQSTEGTGVKGVSGTSDGGAFYSTSGVALRAISDGNYAAMFFSDNVEGAVLVSNLYGTGMYIGSVTPLHLPPASKLEPTALPNLGVDQAGYVRVQDPRPAGAAGPDQARIWACVAQGGTSPATPGAWRVLAGPDSAGSLHLLPSPVRVYDSRKLTNPAVGVKAPLEPNTTRVLDLTANASGVPTSATGVIVNLLLVNAAAGNGNFTLWANGTARPASNTMVWGGTSGRFSTLAVTAVGPAATVQIVTSLRTDVVLDVVGYYR